MTALVNSRRSCFRTASLAGDFTGVDREAEIIRGVAVMRMGDINSEDVRKVFVDEKSLAQFTQMAGSAKGIKGRFTHPDMSNDGLGSFVGRWKNPRIDGDFARADLHVSPRSHDSPKLGDVGKYVLDLAESDPDMFGVSMATLLDDAAMKRERRADGFEPIRLRQLFAIDIVDQPALTNGGLFSVGNELPEQVSRLLDARFAGVPESELRDRVAAYVNRYISNRYGIVPERGDDMGQESSTPAITQESIEAAVKNAATTAVAAAAEQFGALVDGKISAAIKSLKPEEAKPSDVEVERKRCSELFAIAKSAGLEGYEKVAQEAIDKNTSVEAFKASITDRLISQNTLSKDTGEQSTDADAKYKAEYAKQRASFASMGLTEAQYVTSRKVDEGAELL